MEHATHNHTPTHAAIHVIGRFDAHDAPTFRQSVDALLATSVTHLDVDLSEVTFVDSTALAELVHGMKQLRTRGGDLTLHNVSDPVRVILELTRLDLAFDLVDRPIATSHSN